MMNAWLAPDKPKVLHALKIGVAHGDPTVVGILKHCGRHRIDRFISGNNGKFEIWVCRA